MKAQKSSNQNVRVLLIEDEEADASLIKDYFFSDVNCKYDLKSGETLSAALKRLSESCFDVVLLDLNLPDCSGLDTFARIHKAAKEAAIVVLSALQDEQVAIEAVRSGAQDYLVKGQFETELFLRSIRYSIERNKLVIELRKQHEQELVENARSYHHYVSMGVAEPLKLTSSEVDDQLKMFYPIYRDLVFRYINAIRIEKDRPADQVRDLAKQLTKLHVHARDVVRLHLKVISEFSQKAMPAEERAFSNDARLLLVELMGNIMDQYSTNSQKVS
jgi:DNA-binding response OmpR family regulator